MTPDELVNAYVSVFRGPSAETVLADLLQFCKGNGTTVCYDATGRVDANATLIEEGKRQVFNRIVGFSEFDFHAQAELIRSHNAASIRRANRDLDDN